MPTYTLEPGRILARDGKPVARIAKYQGAAHVGAALSPSELTLLAHALAEALDSATGRAREQADQATARAKGDI